MQVYYTLPNEVVGYDVACQVGKAYNICPPASWSFLEGLDVIKRYRSLNPILYFLGTYGIINTAGVVCGPQRLFHYVVRAPGLVFSILTATVASVYELCVSRVIASTSEGRGYYYDCF